jgi:SPP1 family predicted phage head-tail adaptor
MRTGEFKHWIKLLANTPTQDPNNGDLISAESTVAEMWAKVTPMTGSRALNAGQILNGKPYEIQVRYRDDVSIDEDLIIQWGTKRIAIHSVVDQDAAGTILLITGQEVK